MTLRLGVLIFGGLLLFLALLFLTPRFSGVSPCTSRLRPGDRRRDFTGAIPLPSPGRPGTRPREATGERFLDPTTGRLMEVRYNPMTGQRDYVPVDTAGEDRRPGH